MKIYLDLLYDIIKNGERHQDRTGVGTLSVFGRQMRFDLLKTFPLITTKKMPFRWIVCELCWFLSGSTNEKDLRAKGVDIWKEWATAEECAKFGREEGNLGHVYGGLWRNFMNYDGPSKVAYDVSNTGNDQIATLVSDLEKNPNSRRLIVSGWHPVESRRVTLPPCHTLFQFKVHENDEISCHLYARSIDAFLGLPFNIASYALLTKLVAHATDRNARELVISFGDVHIYRNHIEQCKEQMTRRPCDLPDVILHARHRGAGLDGILNFRYEDLVLENYECHPGIKADVAV